MIRPATLCLTQSKAEPDPQAELEFHVDARHLSDDVRVGVAHAVIHSTPSITSLVHVAAGSATALGAPVMANTPTAPAATKVDRFATALPTSSFALRDGLDA